MDTFKVGDLIFYLNNNKVHSANVLALKVIIGEGLYDDQGARAIENGDDESEQSYAYMFFGEEGSWYLTCHGVISADRVYGSREKLVDSL